MAHHLQLEKGGGGFKLGYFSFLSAPWFPRFFFCPHRMERLAICRYGPGAMFAFFSLKIECRLYMLGWCRVEVVFVFRRVIFFRLMGAE